MKNYNFPHLVSSLPIVGQKEFEGSVTISGTDATLNTFNQIDLSSVHSSQAFINQPATFTGVNTFSHPGEISDIQGANYFRATSEINLVDSTIGDAFDVKWLFGHTILKDATDPVPITGTLKFAENVILESDSSVHHLGEYGKEGSYQVSVLTGDNVEVSGVYKFFEKLFLRYVSEGFSQKEKKNVNFHILGPDSHHPPQKLCKADIFCQYIA